MSDFESVMKKLRAEGSTSIWSRNEKKVDQDEVEYEVEYDVEYEVENDAEYVESIEIIENI